LASIFLKTGRLPSEILDLPRGERALIYAAILVEQEENQKAMGGR
jgi:hypothetical protein